VALHEGLGEGLGAFQLRRGLRGAKDAQAVARNSSTTPAASGASGPTTVSAILFGLRKVGQGLGVGDRHVLQPRVGAVPPLPGAT
jgi:hypothetical protein